jgi:hypothetical protein
MKTCIRAMTLLAGVRLVAVPAIGTAQTPFLQPSLGWSRAMPPGPDARVKITEEYARQVGRDAYFWGVADGQHL